MLAELMGRLQGKRSSIYATFLNFLGKLYYGKGDHARAVAIFEEALSIQQERLKPGDPLIAMAQSNLATLTKDLGDYTRAEALFKSALAIEAKANGPDHVSSAPTYNGLALLYKQQGHYAKARLTYQRALDIWTKHLGPDHLKLVPALNNLANLFEEMGEYAKAEPLYQRTLTIARKHLRHDHPSLAVYINNLAMHYFLKGDFDRAEPLYLRALAIDRQTYGPSSPQVATVLGNLAGLYESKGDHARAASLSQKSLSLFLKHRPADHPHVASARHNLAMRYKSAGDYPNARTMIELALQSFEKKFGPDHPRVAGSLQNLALIFALQGDHARAEPLYRRALRIFEGKLGPSHPSVAAVLRNLAESLAQAGRIPLAWPLLCRSLTIDLDRAELLLPPLSERAREAYLAQMVTAYQRLLGLAVAAAPVLSTAPREALELVLRYNGILLSSLRHQRELAASGQNPALGRLLSQRNDALRYLNVLVLHGRGQLSQARYQELLSEARRARERAEEELAQASAALAPEPSLKLDAVARALQPGEALVEIVRFESFPFAPKGGQPPVTWRYAAFVLRGGEAVGGVSLRDLGPAKDIDNLSAAYRSALERGSLQVAHQRDVPFALRWLQKKGQQLYSKVVAPLVPLLRQATTLWISPAGTLGELPLPLLVRPDGKYLGEVLQVSLLSSGRELLRWAVRPHRGGTVPPSTLGAAGRVAAALVAPIYGPGTGSGPQHFGALQWSAGDSRHLQGLLERIAGRGKRLKVTLRSGPQATEATLRRLRRPLVLHLYTHGFYLSDQEVRAWALSTHPGPGESYGAKESIRLFSDPMRRSGLALAGANRGYSPGRQPATDEAGKGIAVEKATADVGLESRHAREDDGILTAEEVGALDLTGTELVVLGACQTGLGAARGGEGIYGLRRALLYAGARSLLVSLWSVPEKETRELLFAFYQALVAGQTKQAALRTAQARIRRTHPLPYYWSGFVLLGDPGRIE